MLNWTQVSNGTNFMDDKKILYRKMSDSRSFIIFDPSREKNGKWYEMPDYAKQRPMIQIGHNLWYIDMRETVSISKLINGTTSSKIILANVYLYHAMAFVSNVTYLFNCGIDPDEALMRALEDSAGITEDRVFEWRRQIWNCYRQRRLDLLYHVMGKTFETFIAKETEWVCEQLSTWSNIVLMEDKVVNFRGQQSEPVQVGRFQSR